MSSTYINLSHLGTASNYFFGGGSSIGTGYMTGAGIGGTNLFGPYLSNFAVGTTNYPYSYSVTFFNELSSRKDGWSEIVFNMPFSDLPPEVQKKMIVSLKKLDPTCVI